ncbi:MAG: hypothetical protein Q8P18_09390 [Pseudomonadota bacterium]|nr:hypothetical protein [Pseudomonadota bacterium]
MLTFLLLSACSPPEEISLAPETHTWKHEGELVVEGLEEVERLWKAGNRDAARVLAERVYTERWEPRLEEAARRLGGTGPAVDLGRGDAVGVGAAAEPGAGGTGQVVEMEYAYSLLLVELEGNGRDLERKVHDLEEKTRAVAEAAARSFPPPASAGLPPPPAAATDGSKPIVPNVKPAWESGGGAAGAAPIDAEGGSTRL